MGHDPTKTLLGSTEDSDRTADVHDSDPASFPAGLAVRKTSTGALSLSSSDGPPIGVSLGKSLSDHKKTSVLRIGDRVPLLLTDEGEFASLEKADLTFTAVEKGLAGNDISIAFVDGGTAGDEEVTVDGTDIEVSMDDGVSTAQQLKDALDASAEAAALIGTEIATGEEATGQAAFAADNLEGGLALYPFVVKGAAVRVSNSTGLAVSSGNTLTGATYVDGPKTGIKEDASEAQVAIIDMGGGL